MWESIDIEGKACAWYEPDGHAAGGACVLFLHGWDEGETIVRDAQAAAALQRHGLRAVCPWGGQTWWLDRRLASFDEQISAENFLLEAVLPAVQRRWQVAPPQIALLGIGMGGQAVLRLCFKRPRQFPVGAAVLPTIDFHLLHGRGGPLDVMFSTREAARQETAILHVNPLNRPRFLFFAADPAVAPWFEGAQRLHEKLAAVGVPHEYDLDSTGGGDVAAYLWLMVPKAIGLLAEALAGNEATS